jgi:hypothetical protein
MDPLIREVLLGYGLSEEEIDNKQEQRVQATARDQNRKAYIKQRKREIRDELSNTTSMVKRGKLNSELNRLIGEEKDLYSKHEEN